VQAMAVHWPRPTPATPNAGMCGKIGWCPAWNTQERRKEMILALEHLDRTVLMFDAVYKIESITPKACRRPED
jgi:hypothetical protein